MRDSVLNAILAIVLCLVSSYLVFKMYHLNIKQQQRIDELEQIIESLKE
jgi:hypothetical protein